MRRRTDDRSAQGRPAPPAERYSGPARCADGGRQRDFGHRSPYETDIPEIPVTVQAIDYLLRHLKRFMQPERRHVALPYRAGRAYVQYQPKGVIGVMAPWNYPSR